MNHKRQIKKQMRMLNKLTKLQNKIWFQEHVLGVVYDTKVYLGIQKSIESLKDQLGVFW